MFGESSGKKVQVGEQIFGMINPGAGADAGAVIQQIEQRIVSFVAREPTVGSGIQLPERADFKALPATKRSGLAACGGRVSQIMGDGPPADGGRVDLKSKPTINFGGGKAVRSRRAGGKELAHECFNALGPVRGVITTRMARYPTMLLMPSGGPQIIGIKFVETGAAQPEFFGGGGGGQFAVPKGGEDFADQRRT